MAGKKLLVADDSLTIQKVIRLALSNEGYEIQAVSDGNDAIQQISLFRPDVILIDVSLPGKTAFEVKRAINELADLEEVRFVLMSSAFEKVDEPQADQVKFHGRLTKPFDPAHLRQVLADALAQVAPKQTEVTSSFSHPQGAPPLPKTAQGSPPPLPFGDEIDLDDDLPPPPAAAALTADDWLHPVRSHEPIVSPPPPSEPVSNLWDMEPNLNLSPPPELPLSPSSHEPDADIRHLTESTIRMSGLDDFQWSVNEPSLRPPGGLQDSGGASFQIEPHSEQNSTSMPPFRPEFVPEITGVTEASPDPEHEPSITNLSPPPSELGAASSPSDFYQDSADITKKLTRPSMPFTPPPIPPMSAVDTSVIPISQDQMEEIIRKQLQETFQKLAEKLLPEMAERIIKQEIHRMLSET